MAASSGRSRIDELARSARPGVAGRDALGDCLLELALLAPFFQRLEAVPLVEEVDEDEREREHAPEQGEGHGAVDLRLQLVVEDGPLLVQRAPPVDREVHDGHVHERDERRDRATGRAAVPTTGGPRRCSNASSLMLPPGATRRPASRSTCTALRTAPAARPTASRRRRRGRAPPPRLGWRPASPEPLSAAAATGRASRARANLQPERRRGYRGLPRRPSRPPPPPRAARAIAARRRRGRRRRRPARPRAPPVAQRSRPPSRGTPPPGRDRRGGA